MKLSAHDIRRLSVEAKRDPRTVRAWYADRGSVRSTADAALTDAANRLGLPTPSAILILAGAPAGPDA